MLAETVPTSFDCEGSELYGLLELPEAPKDAAVLVVVGGPQYRVGSHRQFTLLCRALAAEGFAAMRFDHRGVGDSEGSTTFEALDLDISAAIDELTERVPEANSVVIWGLCDAASAAMMYAAKDERVRGLVLVNPWLRDDTTVARAYVRYYYLKQLVSREFWRRFLTGRLNVLASLCSLFQTAASALRRTPAAGGALGDGVTQPFQLRMRTGLSRFEGNVLVILSGEDITAAEFEQSARADRHWRSILEAPHVTIKRLPDANHTFSRAKWRSTVEQRTLEWMMRCLAKP